MNVSKEDESSSPKNVDLLGFDIHTTLVKYLHNVAQLILRYESMAFLRYSTELDIEFSKCFRGSNAEMSQD